jgi:hypothetical protein
LTRTFPVIHVVRVWHARKDLNPQPAVLETAALPIELRAYVLRVRFANLYAGYASIIIRDGYRGVKQFSGAYTCYIGRTASVPAVDMTRRLRVKSPFPFPTPPCIISQTWTSFLTLQGEWREQSCRLQQVVAGRPRPCSGKSSEAVKSCYRKGLEMFGATDIDAQIIAGWQGFFSMAAGTSAGLAGLVFVALSMHLKGIRAHPHYQYRTRSSLASLMLVFVMSSLMLFPRQPSEWLGLEGLAVIGAEFTFLIWSFLRARAVMTELPLGLTVLQPYLVRTILAIGVCLFGMVGAALVWAGLDAGFYILASFIVVTVVWVVINTWALVMGITDEDESSGSSGVK